MNPSKINDSEATELAATLSSYVTVYISCPPSIGKIIPTKNNKNVIISMSGPNLRMKGIGSATTVAKKAARQRMPSAYGDDEPPTFVVMYAPR